MRLGKTDRTAKLTTKKERITVDRTTETVEVDLDFTQLYNCFFYLSIGIKKAGSFQILFFLLRNMERDNQVAINQKLLGKYADLLKQLGKPPITDQAFYRSLTDLQRAGVMTKLSRGIYFLNPYAMWKDDTKSRKDYLQIDAGTGQTMAINPIDLLINAPDVDVIVEDITDEEVKQINSDY